MATERPILNPTLRLTLEPATVPGKGGGKSQASIKQGRLAEQRLVLSDHFSAVLEDPKRLAHMAGRTLVVARMFADSLAPSHTPDDLFPVEDCRFIAPLPSGYLIDVADSALKRLARSARSSENTKMMSDISRVRSVKPFSRKAMLRGQTLESLWEKGLKLDGGDRLFTAWLMPFGVEKAREGVLARWAELSESQMILPFHGQPAGARQSLATSTVGSAMRSYRASRGVGRATVRVSSLDNLTRLIGSGTVFRMDPVRSVSLSTAPVEVTANTGSPQGRGPIVACIDGGMTDPAYTVSEAWRETAFVSDADADHAHGNAVSSLIAHGAALNPNLNLPELECRLGIAQAVPHQDCSTAYLPDDLFDLLSRIATRHRDTRVWNLSFNLADFDDDPDLMSDFGHQISVIARAGGVLPVISIGNKDGSKAALLPPADAEAALTVGGRASNAGFAGDHCGVCCSGPGPGGTLKPDISWFSPVTVGGGSARVGSSFAAALTSNLAAHTFDRLKDPTPDLVKALLISQTERTDHHPGLGWGSPFHETAPWECEPGTVTMAWNAYLERGFDYYWRDIPIPAEMLADGKLVGAASLTAVLEPLKSPFAGENYFASRVEVGVQFKDANGKWSNLLGTMQESTLDEATARNDLKKWQPVRHHKKARFARAAADAPTLRVRARLYTRDHWQPGLLIGGLVPPHRVAFVLKMAGREGGDGIYNSMVRGLGNFVESAVIDQSIEIET